MNHSFMEDDKMTNENQKERLINIANAATIIFVEKGYKNTQMINVAQHLNVSVGTLYIYIKSKKALYDITLMSIFDNNFYNKIQNLPFEGIEHNILLEQYVHKVFNKYISDYKNIIEKKDIDNDFEIVISSIFTLMTNYWPGMSIFEKGDDSWPKFSKYYFNIRSEYFDLLKIYIEKKISQNIIRPLENIDIYSRLIIETIAWFAIHRNFDEDLKKFDNSTIKNIVIDSLKHSFLREEYL